MTVANTCFAQKQVRKYSCLIWPHMFRCNYFLESDPMTIAINTSFCLSLSDTFPIWLPFLSSSAILSAHWPMLCLHSAQWTVHGNTARWLLSKMATIEKQMTVFWGGILNFHFLFIKRDLVFLSTMATTSRFFPRNRFSLQICLQLSGSISEAQGGIPEFRNMKHALLCTFLCISRCMAVQ